MNRLSSIRMRAAGLLVIASLALTSCFISPGKFTSQLELEDDGSFAFTYDGEIFFLGLSDLAKMGNSIEDFSPDECYDDDTFDVRECSDAELAEQRSDWEDRAEQKAVKAEKEAQEMSAMMGGIDPTDPEATEKLRQLLLRHNGWNKVEAKGNGMFDIEYAITGHMTHDMMFPVIEGFPSPNMFVQVIVRDSNVVRVNAPGFSAQGDKGSMGSMGSMMGGMAGMAGIAAMNEAGGDEEGESQMPVLDGTFSIITNGEILANNTDEGPQTIDEKAVLSWEIDNGTASAPTALIKLQQ